MHQEILPPASGLPLQEYHAVAIPTKQSNKLAQDPANTGHLGLCNPAERMAGFGGRNCESKRRLCWRMVPKS